MNRIRYVVFFVGFLIVQVVCRGQQPDSLPHPAPPADTVHPGKHPKSPYAVDSPARKRHDPGKASLRSAIIPGWGQIYNHKYWKLPIVYAAIGIPAYTFFYNRMWYNNCQQALTIIDTYFAQGYSAVPDSVIAKLKPKLQPLVASNNDNGLRTIRNEYRKDEDYSILFFALFWGLNVVDATVDAHLMYFDVSDQLGMRIQQPTPGFTPPGSATGISVVFDFHKARFKPLSLH